MTFTIQGAYTHRKKSCPLVQEFLWSPKYHIWLRCQFQHSLIRTFWPKRHHFSISNKCYISGRLTILKISLKCTGFIKTVFVCKTCVHFCFETKQRSKGLKNKHTRPCQAKERPCWETFGLSLTHGLSLFPLSFFKLPMLMAACRVGAQKVASISCHVGYGDASLTTSQTA